MVLKNRKSAKPISAVFIWDLYCPSWERCTTLIISMYIYFHCVDPAFPPLPVGYLPLLGFLFLPFPPEYRIYMDRAGLLCTDLNFGLILARDKKKKPQNKTERKKERIRWLGGNKCLNTGACGGGAGAVGRGWRLGRAGGRGARRWCCLATNISRFLAKTLKQPLKTLIKRGN